MQSWMPHNITCHIPRNHFPSPKQNPSMSCPNFWILLACSETNPNSNHALSGRFAPSISLLRPSLRALQSLWSWRTLIQIQKVIKICRSPRRTQRRDDASGRSRKGSSSCRRSCKWPFVGLWVHGFHSNVLCVTPRRTNNKTCP